MLSNLIKSGQPFKGRCQKHKSAKGMIVRYIEE